MTGANGVSIHIGLNHVNPANYGGWDGALGGCIPDAKDMQAIAKAQGLTSKLLIDSEATSTAVIEALKDASTKLKSGDYLLITYSGHGGQVPDNTGEESDYKDETWVLWDRQLIDDELDLVWSWFQGGVNVLVLSDSCHSGTVTKAVRNGMLEPVSLTNTRRAPQKVCEENYVANEALYLDVKNTARMRGLIYCSVLLISGCQDNQYSGDTGSNGVFTNRVKAVWNNGAYQGDHVTFYRSILQGMPSDQTPNLFWNGVISNSFSNARPFTIPMDFATILPNRIALKATINGKYVCAENAGTSSLIANRDVAYSGDANGNGSWEIFEVKPMGAPGTNRIALKATINGKYVCAENAGTSSLIANRDVAYSGDANGNGSWEIFVYQKM
jgi:hypothetical protein